LIKKKKKTQKKKKNTNFLAGSDGWEARQPQKGKRTWTQIEKAGCRRESFPALKNKKKKTELGENTS